MNKMTIANPVIWADVPDPDVIRVENTFYMVSTSMHSMPGCPIMKSENLRDWEIVNYVFDSFEDNEAHELRDGKGIYAKGSWAASLRYHNGFYHVCFSSNDMQQFYIYRTADIENGDWERHVIQGLHHDPGLLFDEGRLFVFHGNGDIRITELTEDATGIKAGGLNQILFETEREGFILRAEGCHAYKLNSYYYLFFIDWPSTHNWRRRQLCYRSRELLGPYEHKVILDDDMGYQNKGIAQGGIIDTPAGEWYAFLFQDHGSVGRIPCVLPLQWVDDWPVIGVDGKTPQSFEAELPDVVPTLLVISDEFNYDKNKLALNWQWNHNSDHKLWSVTDRFGWLRLHTGDVATGVEYARNTLTQRTEGPACSGKVLLDTSSMQAGDYAGMVALQSRFGTIGLEVLDNGERRLNHCVKSSTGNQETLESVPWAYNRVHLKIDFDFRNSVDFARFFYSADGEVWDQLGVPLQMSYSLEHFMGYRIGLFNYATKQAGGFADFDYFRYTRLA